MNCISNGNTVAVTIAEIADKKAPAGINLGHECLTLSATNYN